MVITESLLLDNPTRIMPSVKGLFPKYLYVSSILETSILSFPGVKSRISSFPSAILLYAKVFLPTPPTNRSPPKPPWNRLDVTDLPVKTSIERPPVKVLL